MTQQGTPVVTSAAAAAAAAAYHDAGWWAHTHVRIDLHRTAQHSTTTGQYRTLFSITQHLGLCVHDISTQHPYPGYIVRAVGLLTYVFSLYTTCLQQMFLAFPPSCPTALVTVLCLKHSSSLRTSPPRVRTLSAACFKCTIHIAHPSVPQWPSPWRTLACPALLLLPPSQHLLSVKTHVPHIC